ncbi:hypothetical protein F0562_026541 [Nyssa sinensis]|uniref:Alpha/beta hydrolase fold-3 domain-containing protein n=1 Tax=Nyssa sinensis TaxID=561372 RepID=A0A5J5BB03_9ASTE|nr:hypothetical protein F0562_026541 [Nyssa sinensis]
MAGNKIVPPTGIDIPFLNIVRTPDGLIKRDPIPSTPAAVDLNGSSPVLTKDVPLNPQHKTWLRLYLPRHAKNASAAAKLPLIVYYHGGGFIFFHADSTIFHDFCVGMAAQIGVMVVSVEYRLAPDHRLPAAYEDAMEGLHWIKSCQDQWLIDYADISTCYLSGTSAGGNIAYHAGLRAAIAAKDLEPLKIKGLILHQPYFGASRRTESEDRLINDPILPLHASDTMWDLSLPIGAHRDHEYCNPTVDGGSKHIERFRELEWRILVTGCCDDPLVDSGKETVKFLERKGVQTATHFGTA